MAGIGEMVTGSGARQQRRLAAAAQDEQAKRIAEEKARVDEIERGQKVVARRGGAGGLLAYVDDNLKGTFGA